MGRCPMLVLKTAVKLLMHCNPYAHILHDQNLHEYSQRVLEKTKKKVPTILVAQGICLGLANSVYFANNSSPYILFYEIYGIGQP